VKTGNVCDTIKLAAHCINTAMDKARLLTLLGNISDNKTQTTGPQEIENDAINNSRKGNNHSRITWLYAANPTTDNAMHIPADTMYNIGLRSSMLRTETEMIVKTRFTSPSILVSIRAVLASCPRGIKMTGA